MGNHDHLIGPFPALLQAQHPVEMWSSRLQAETFKLFPPPSGVRLTSPHRAE